MSKPPFVLLVTGSRDAVSSAHCQAMRAALESIAAKVSPQAWEWHVVHGCAMGADSYCGQFVKVAHWCGDDEVHGFPADWTQGDAAGPLRNQRMVDWVVQQRDRNGDRVGCVAFPAEQDVAKQTGGTFGCIRRAEAAGIKVVRVPLDVSAERAARLARRR